MNIEECNFSREISEKKQFQIINTDTGKKAPEVILFAIFKWKDKSSDEVLSGTFKMMNIQHLKSRYVIDDIFFCEDENRIEIHIARDEKNAKDSVTVRKSLTGMKLDENTVNFVWRVRESNAEERKTYCQKFSKDEHEGLTPDDKNGSIIIGAKP